MADFLLTGAGFSRNWGGLLANEVFEYLLGSPRIDASLRGLLWKHKEQNQGFEDALGELQLEYARRWNAQTEQDLQNLINTLYEMFGEMNYGFSLRHFEPQQGTGLNVRESVTAFLSRFDAIFTLNQDTLLEQKYLSERKYNDSKRLGCYRPGLIKSADKLSVGTQIVQLYKPADTFELDDRGQPYFKLHGSSDLQDGERGMMLIMGANKHPTLEAHPLLKWYLEQFTAHLSKPSSRLMIIGYSFADVHINKVIIDAVKHGLKIFIIDPSGIDALDRRKSDQPSLYNVYQDLKDHVIGASRRPLMSVFGKNDPVEFERIQRFFKLNEMLATVTSI